MENYEAGLKKKSFSLFYHGGEIWCEHLDAMYDKTGLVMQKFTQDLEQIAKPSASAFLAVVLSETMVDEELLTLIFKGLGQLERPLRKVVFVGLNFKMRWSARKHAKAAPFAVKCINDFEKAKAWLI